MIFTDLPPAKWKVTALNVQGKRIELGRYFSDEQLADVWDHLNRIYDQVQVEAANKKAV